MSTIGIVLLSLLGGLALALLLGVSGYLAYALWRANRLLKDIQSQVPLLVEEYRRTLTEQISTLNAKIGQINGEDLKGASDVILRSARRIEQACIAFGELAKTLISEDALQRTQASGLAPEEYAPAEPGERFVTQGRTAAQDSSESAEGRETDFQKS